VKFSDLSLDNIENKIQKIALLVAGVFVLIVSLYIITAPLYKIADALSLISKNFSKLDLVKKELKDLHNDFGKLNEQVDDSTLLGI
jgi:peptidoglycan hydrolase CwlO-like protein